MKTVFIVAEGQGKTQGLVRAFPAAAVAGTIFCLSSLPGTSIHLPNIVNIDKVLHAIAYSALASALLLLVPRETILRRPWSASLMIVLCCVLYGLSDEFHQAFVPCRTPSLFDLLADAVGAAAAVTVWQCRERCARKAQ